MVAGGVCCCRVSLCKTDGLASTSDGAILESIKPRFYDASILPSYWQVSPMAVSSGHRSTALEEYDSDFTLGISDKIIFVFKFFI